MRSYGIVYIHWDWNPTTYTYASQFSGVQGRTNGVTGTQAETYWCTTVLINGKGMNYTSPFGAMGLFTDTQAPGRVRCYGGRLPQRGVQQYQEPRSCTIPVGLVRLRLITTPVPRSLAHKL